MDEWEHLLARMQQLHIFQPLKADLANKLNCCVARNSPDFLKINFIQIDLNIAINKLYFKYFKLRHWEIDYVNISHLNMVQLNVF